MDALLGEPRTILIALDQSPGLVPWKKIDRKRREGFEGKILQKRRVEVNKKAGGWTSVHTFREVLNTSSNAGAEFAFHWAMKNYCKPNDVINLLYVRRNIDDMTQWRLPAEVAARVEREAEAGATAFMQKYIDRGTQANFKCRGRTVVGDERQEICKEVLWVCADVLIVGSRGLNCVQRVLLGSVSEYCAHHSACPVIIVKPSSSVSRFNNDDSTDSSSEMHIPGLDSLEET